MEEADLLLSLPDDVLVLVSSHLTPRDLSSLSLCSRSLHSAVSSSDKIWLSQCRRTPLPPHLLPRWRSGVSSYRSLCRFLLSVSPLLGLWVHQNPELGNVVLLSLGPFLSLLARRVIPQELSPRGGLRSGPLLWAPVFEILSSFHGVPHLFFLHGRTAVDDHRLYPGSVLPISPNPNVLLLEVDSHPESPPFSRLAFADRRRLLDAVSERVCLKNVPLFSDDDESAAAERRASLFHVHSRAAGGRIDWRSAGLNSADRPPSAGAGSNRRSFFSVVRQIVGKPGGASFISSKNRSSAAATAVAASNGGDSSSKHVALSEFLKGADTVGLTLRAANVRLTTYRAWPNMHDNQFALYKLPLQEAADGREYAGLWGGTFGWPPGRPSEDKPGKALFFLLLSYEEIAGELHLIATKILEGTHYVLHPNGSAMFIVKVNEPSADLFPWEMDGEGARVEVKHSFSGEGIANGDGFRYPGSKPGSLFEIHNGLLAFVWKESKSVLTLQRLDLEELLKKGERVPPLPPIANFAYLTKSYSNVFAGFPSSCSPSPSR
ncbi:F-box protein-like isoform X1 [Iris pallida]|uniref:F-box protein-like isoform X1 n=1 Tax=Iris pallida TaxID=29817 RepID=A0AAX6E392_IRIPA|nr:F-box protein-like isoform X1 [Iris pallida]